MVFHINFKHVHGDIRFMVYREDFQLVVTFLALLFISWLVFLRFAAAELSTFTLVIFLVAWLASVIVATIHIFTPAVLTFGIVAHRLHRKSARKHTKNSLFVLGHLSAWLFLGVLFYFSMQFFGYSLSSKSLYIVVGYAAIIAGVYKFLSSEHINASRVMSPELFFSKHWRDGHRGAYAMGTHHAVHILSSYWPLTLVLLLAGFSSILLLGLLSATIFAERISTRPVFLSRITGMCFIAGGLAALMYTPLLLSVVGIK